MDTRRTNQEEPAGNERVVETEVQTVSTQQDGVLEGSLVVRSKAPGVDLVAFDARVSPLRARAGERVRVTVAVANLGDGRSPATRLVVREGSDGRTYHGEAAVPALDPGQSVELTAPTRLPRDLSEGRLWLSATVDPEHRLPQSDRENDEAWVAVEIRGRYDRDVDLGREDLVFDASGRPAAGRAFYVRARVHNRGRGRVDDADVEVLLVGPGTTTRSLGRRILGVPLAEGAGLDWADRFVLPSDLPPGSYVLRLRIDPDARLPWAGAGGGIAEIPFVVGTASVTVGPDLVALGLEPLPGSGVGRRTFSFTARIANRGSEPAGQFEASLELEPGAEGAGAAPCRSPSSVRRTTARG